MSINVTVKANPINISRGKMIISDLERVKKYEQDQRKRLRLEQVHEQTRALSKSILERAQQNRKEAIEKLAQQESCEHAREQDKRLNEMHRRYQEADNIGYAHENATRQPDVQAIRLEEEERNRRKAKERGAVAAKRLHQSKNVATSTTIQQDKLRKARDMEKQRSCMVARLPNKICVAYSDTPEVVEDEVVNKTYPSSAAKKKVKHVIAKKSPIKKLSKLIKAQPRISPRVSVTINDEVAEMVSGTAALPVTESSKEKVQSCLPNVPKKISDIGRNSNDFCESDVNEPRRNVPVTSSTSSKPDNFFSHITYNKENYPANSSTDLSSTLTASSTSVSDDSSYFSDTSKKQTVKRSNNVSPVKSKVDMYDYKTRQRKTYDCPSGLVEKMNIKNKPRAEELAQEVMENKSRESFANQNENSKERGKNAIIKEKIRRNYDGLIKNLDMLMKEERKLRASQVSSTKHQQILNPSKRKADEAKRQKKMDRVFENILRASRATSTNLDSQVERPITITPRDYIHDEPTPNRAWTGASYDNQESSSEESYSVDEKCECAQKRKISELLIKIEKMKRSLLQEYGEDLPDSVFSASMKSLFDEPTPKLNEKNIPSNKTLNLHEQSQMEVINMSKEESNRPPKKIFKFKPPPVIASKKISKSLSEGSRRTKDQQVQVELESERMSGTTSYQKLNGGYSMKKAHSAESVLKFVSSSNDSNSTCSNSSTSTDVVIDVKNKEITVVPKSRDSAIKLSKKISSTAEHTVKPNVNSSAATNPVRISFSRNSNAFEVGGLLIDPNKKEITVLPQRREASEQRERCLEEIPDDVHSNQKSVKSATKEKNKISAKKTATPTKKSRSNQPTSAQSRSLPNSRASSPVKKQSKSAPSSPKKVCKNLMDKQLQYKSQCTQVSIDSSTTDSSIQYSDAGKSLYCRIETMAAQRFANRMQDTSDTSTTYASPPSCTPGTFLNNNSSTSILELLDPNGSLLSRGSPQSVVPKTLKLLQMMRRQTQTSGVIEKDKRYECTCKNPECKVMHEKIDGTQAYALKHCPEMLKKYEDLQNVCTERINSLTNLIHKVRNEQKGLEQSVVTPEDSNPATASIPSSQPPQRLQATQRNVELMKNLDAIQEAIKKTLTESKRIIESKGIELSVITVPSDNTPTTTIDLSKDDSVINISNDDCTPKGEQKISPLGSRGVVTETLVEKSKPRIVNDEPVRINLERFHRSQPKEKSSAEKKDACDLKNELTVEMISKEILEQSKSINKSVPTPDNLKDSDDSILKPISQANVVDMIRDTPVRDLNNEPDNQDPNPNYNNHSAILPISSGTEFIPLLAGIPKVTTAKTPCTSVRGRPPVTLISGPYSHQQIDSPAHELSTIVEFDTPETVNRSLPSHQTPSNKCRRKLQTNSELTAALSTASSPSKSADFQIPKSKPYVSVAPLPVHRQSPQKLNKSSTKVTPTIDKSIDKSLESLDKWKKISSESMYTLPDVMIELEQSHDNENGNDNYERISQISELHTLPDENVENLVISDMFEENKSKSTKDNSQDDQVGNLSKSNSSRSLSGLSRLTYNSSPSSDVNMFVKCPSSPEDLKNLGLGWAIPMLKKTREASALGSSSSSDVTPVNTAPRLVSPLKKAPDGTLVDMHEISDVSSISIKHANKSTERSVLIKGRTSTPNRYSNNSNNSNNSVKFNNTNNRNNTSSTISTLGSFSSDINLVLNQSAENSIPNISFSNNQFA